MNIEEQVELLMQGTEYGDAALKEAMTKELRERLVLSEKEGRPLREVQDRLLLHENQGFLRRPEHPALLQPVAGQYRHAQLQNLQDHHPLRQMAEPLYRAAHQPVV